MMQAFAPPIAAPAPGRQFQWLGFDGAELPGSNGSGMACPADPRARITNRTKLSDKQLDALVSAFDREPMPSPEQRDALAHKLDQRRGRPRSRHVGKRCCPSDKRARCERRGNEGAREKSGGREASRCAERDGRERAAEHGHVASARGAPHARTHARTTHAPRRGETSLAEEGYLALGVLGIETQ